MKPEAPLPDPELVATINNTCEFARHYADLVLSQSTIHTHILQSQYPFSVALPAIYRMPGEKVSTPATAISSIDMDLTYQRASRRFSANSFSLNLDNDYSVLYYRTPMKRPADNPLDIHRDTYALILLNPQKKYAAEVDHQPVVSQQYVNQLMSDLGIHLPLEPHEADWDIIENIFQFAQHWTARAEHITQLTLRNRLRVESRVDGVGLPVLDAFDIASRKPVIGGGGRMHQLTTDIEFSDTDFELPSRALRLVQHGEDSLENARFTELQTLPILYVDTLMNRSNNASREQIIRTDLSEGSRVEASLEHMHAFNNAIKLALQP